MFYISICRWLYHDIFQKRLNKCIPSVSRETILGEGFDYGANDRLGYSELETDEATRDKTLRCPPMRKTRRQSAQ